MSGIAGVERKSDESCTLLAVCGKTEYNTLSTDPSGITGTCVPLIALSLFYFVLLFLPLELFATSPISSF